MSRSFDGGGVRPQRLARRPVGRAVTVAGKSTAPQQETGSTPSIAPAAEGVAPITADADTSARQPASTTEPIALLNRAGLVITAPRLAVLQVLRQAPPDGDGFMTLNDIHAGLHACNARLSLIGVYQMLHRLAQAGVLERQAYGPIKQGARVRHAFRLRQP